MRPPLKERKSGRTSIGLWIRRGTRLPFLLSPTRDAEAAKRFFCKVLHVTADSAPQVRPIEEQVAQPTASVHPTLTTPTPRVINVDKNAAYPKAIADLKAAGILPESVELRQVKYLNNLIEQDHRAHQTVDKAWDGLCLVRDGLANVTRIRDDEHDEERASARCGQGEHSWAGHLHRQPVWSRYLS
jgi:DDE domain